MKLNSEKKAVKEQVWGFLQTNGEFIIRKNLQEKTKQNENEIDAYWRRNTQMDRQERVPVIKNYQWRSGHCMPSTIRNTVWTNQSSSVPVYWIWLRNSCLSFTTKIWRRTLIAFFFFQTLNSFYMKCAQEISLQKKTEKNQVAEQFDFLNFPPEHLLYSKVGQCRCHS